MLLLEKLFRLKKPTILFCLTFFLLSSLIQLLFKEEDFLLILNLNCIKGFERIGFVNIIRFNLNFYLKKTKILILNLTLKMTQYLKN